MSQPNARHECRNTWYTQPVCFISHSLPILIFLILTSLNSVASFTLTAMNHLKKTHSDDNGDYLLACWCLLQVVLSLKESNECFQMFQWEVSTVQKQYAGDIQRCTWMVSLLVVCDTALCAAGTGLLAPPGGRSCRTTCIITQTSYQSTRKEEEVNQERQLTTSNKKCNDKYDPKRIHKYEQKTREQWKSDSVVIHLYMNNRFHKAESLSLSWSRHSSPRVQPGGAVITKACFQSSEYSPQHDNSSLYNPF
jgi:hypothetical protein